LPAEWTSHHLRRKERTAKFRTTTVTQGIDIPVKEIREKVTGYTTNLIGTLQETIDASERVVGTWHWQDYQRARKPGIGAVAFRPLPATLVIKRVQPRPPCMVAVCHVCIATALGR
jgi:hypothetical protein